MKKILSVCIPTYNRQDLLKKQLTFLANENVFEYQYIEVIISDNASTDGTSEYLKKIKQEYQNIKIFNNKINCGLISNLRKLIELSIGDYIWVIGDDDILHNGIFKKITSIIKEYDNLSHIFLNHSINKNGSICNKKMYTLEKVGFMNGMDLFNNVTESAGLGTLMFITANIYKRELVLKALAIIDEYNENENLALPLGLSLFCSQNMSYLLDDVFLEDEIGTISWKKSSYKVFCRDMIAICDIFSNHIGKNNEISKLLIKNLPYRMPELIYPIYKAKYKYESNNYALKWMWKNYPINLLFDIIKFPFLVVMKIIKNL